jgi:hypothetical protein
MMLDHSHAQPPARLTVLKTGSEAAQISCQSRRAVNFGDPYDNRKTAVAAELPRLRLAALAARQLTELRLRVAMIGQAGHGKRRPSDP